MAPSQRHHSGNEELASTYFVQERHGEEPVRLSLQDRMLTKAMDGTLFEQSDPGIFRHVFNIGCGTGGWITATALTYPEITCVGIDSSRRMIQAATLQAVSQQVETRVSFQVMDALHLLEFSAHSFDLVNLRLGMSFLRTWDWPKLLLEMRRVTRPGGIIRLTDQNILHVSSSSALIHVCERFLCAFDRAGHLFEPEHTGLIAHFAPLLERFGCHQIQHHLYPLVFRAGTEEGYAYAENIAMLLKAAQPFLERRGCLSEDYDTLSNQVRSSMQQAEFQATWTFLTSLRDKRIKKERSCGIPHTSCVSGTMLHEEKMIIEGKMTMEKPSPERARKSANMALFAATCTAWCAYQSMSSVRRQQRHLFSIALLPQIPFYFWVFWLCTRLKRQRVWYAVRTLLVFPVQRRWCPCN